MSFGKCCVSGHLHEGTPKGTVKPLYGLDTYITGEESNKDKTIVYVTDIFGYQLNNAKLLADEYAAQGHYVVMPDLMKNDSIDHELLLKIAPRASLPERSTVQAGLDGASVMATLGPWLARNSEGTIRPRLEEFVTELKKDSAVKKVGAVGFCWGGRYAVLLGHKYVDAVVACHPSFLGVTADLEDVKAPLYIGVGDKDDMYPKKDQDATQEFFKEKKSDVPFELEIYPGEVHGFAVRGDINVDSEKAAKEKIATATLNWFQKYLA